MAGLLSDIFIRHTGSSSESNNRKHFHFWSKSVFSRPSDEFRVPRISGLRLTTSVCFPIVRNGKRRGEQAWCWSVGGDHKTTVMIYLSNQPEQELADSKLLTPNQTKLSLSHLTHVQLIDRLVMETGMHSRAPSSPNKKWNRYCSIHDW